MDLAIERDDFALNVIWCLMNLAINELSDLSELSRLGSIPDQIETAL